MKRLYFPALLVLASLITAALFTTVTAVTLASYAKENKSAVVVTAQSDVTDNATVSR